MRKWLSSLFAVMSLAIVAVSPGGQPRAAAPTLVTLVSFCVLANCVDGSVPQPGLILDAQGNLFGTTIFGGGGASPPMRNPGQPEPLAPGGGTIFEIAKTATGYASTPTILVSFCMLPNCVDGGYPSGGLIADADGNLLGTAGSGGTKNFGTVFEIAKTATGYASTPTILWSFCSLANCADACCPSGVIADADGNLFGTAAFVDGSRTVFEIAKTAAGYASTPTILVSDNNLAFPAEGLLIDAGGNLIITTGEGGAHDGGTVFEIAKTATGYASTPTILWSFCSLANCADGSSPEAGVIADAGGNLFGTTEYGGAYGGGTIFEIAKTATGYASTPTILVSFCAGVPNCPTDGAASGVGIADAKGNLFGSGSTVSPHAVGTLFELAKTAGGYASIPTTLVSFCPLSNNCASWPASSLVADRLGNLFGTACGGAGMDPGTPCGAGTVFEVTNSGFVSTVPFAWWDAGLIIQGSQRARFELDAKFGLGAGSNGINPPSEPVTLQIGPYTATIPAGSFRQLPSGKHWSVYAFIGKESNVQLEFDILSLGPKSYQLGAAGGPVNLTGPNRMPVSLQIGDHSGSAVVKAERLH